MLDRLIIDNVSSDEYEVYLTDAGVFESPEPVYETFEVEGRSGDLIIDKNRYKNISVRYPAVIYSDFERNYLAFRSFLLSRKGYLRLEDTFFPERYRLGRVIGDLSPKYPKEYKIGTFEVKFWCKPQWYLKDGENQITLFGSGTLFNPTVFEANPIIRVYGSGEVGVGSETLTISEGADEFIDIDCEILDCYEETLNRNNLVSMTGWPKLPAGPVNISLGTGITKVVITPRWYLI